MRTNRLVMTDYGWRMQCDGHGCQRLLNPPDATTIQPRLLCQECFDREAGGHPARSPQKEEER